MRRKLFCIAVLLCVFVSISGTCAFAQGEEAAQLPHVTDAADILSESETETLDTIAAQTTAAHLCGVYIITIDDYRDYTDGSIADCSETLYNHYQLGWGEERNGIVLLLSMYDRDYDLCAYGSIAHAAFTDYGKGELADMFLGDFRGDDWYGGFVNYIRGCDELLKLYESGEPLDVSGHGGDTELSPGFKLAMLILVPCAIAMVVCVIFMAQMKSARIKTEANDYVVPDSLVLSVRDDIYTHSTETRQTIETTRSSGGGGTSINSGGFSHHSGKF